MEDIIAVGLLYRYIVTGEREMPIKMANSYIEAVKKGLITLNSKHDINENSERFASAYELTIDEDRETYSFSSLAYDFMIILSLLSRELATASLSYEALDALEIKREDLPISTHWVTKAGEMEISSMSLDDAINNAREILEADKFRNIRILAATPSQPDDKAYQVSYMGSYNSSEINREEVDNKLRIVRLEVASDEQRAKIAPLMDKDQEIELEKLYVADTFLASDDNIKVADKKRIVFPIDQAASHINYCADLFEDEIMSCFWRCHLRDGEELVIASLEPLDKEMKVRYATIGEIEEFVRALNSMNVKKELKPENRERL